MTDTNTAKTRTPRKTVHRLGHTAAPIDALIDGSKILRAFEVCKMLHDGGIVPTRDLLVEKTGFTPGAIDEALKQLRKMGLVSRDPASYKPIEQFAESRAISGSPLPNGAFKLEVGDDLLTLTPDEARKAGLLLQGYALDCVALLPVRMMQDRMSRMESDYRRLCRQHQNTLDENKALKAQANLPGTSN